MARVGRALVVGVGAIILAVGAAVPASADPTDDPCPLSMAFLCRFLPVAPDLDHDIDLTQDPATINGQTLPQMPAAGEMPEGAPVP